MTPGMRFHLAPLLEVLKEIDRKMSSGSLGFFCSISLRARGNLGS